MIYRITRKFIALALLAPFMFIIGCKDDDDDANVAGTFYGPEVSVGQGNAKAWVTTDGAGTPTAVGVTLSEAAVNASNLGNAMRMYMLHLPSQANKTLYDHVMLDWNPQGHEPAGLYDQPHFDLHFYMVPEATVSAIQGSMGMDVEPDAQYVPENYILTPGIVPGMGAHWINVTDQNNSPGNFAKNFIYGSYNGKFIFHEPMFTLDYLSTLPAKGSETMSIPQPAAYQQSGLYPQKYRFSYNSSSKEYSIILEDFIQK
ncbi:DUF5602 domain-containing protein [Pontibacter sp. 13R65]|uniref:DUF5602 domain-containing protein n=1 Tax=Pontibacter sp. 13R65 TaxID=3127458 RepID=UPI00301C5885